MLRIQLFYSRRKEEASIIRPQAQVIWLGVALVFTSTLAIW